MHTKIQSQINREIEEQHKEGKNLEPVEEADMEVEVSCVEDLKQLCQTNVKPLLFPTNALLLVMASNLLRSTKSLILK